MKKQNLLIGILWMVFFNPILAQVNIDSALIAYYPFNGNANDESLNSNNGTVNGPTLIADRLGRADRAYNFNGITDFISTNSSLGNFGMADFSVSFWISNAKNAGKIISKRPLCTSTNFWEISVLQNKLRVVVFDGGVHEVLSTSVVTDSDWHYIVAIRQGAQLRIYVDGSLNNLSSGSGIANLSNSATLNFGTSPCVGLDTSKRYDGVLDDVRIYQRAITNAEVTALFNAESCIFTVYDTVRVSIYDTTHVIIYDTVTVIDTVAVTDTLYIDVILSTNPLVENQIKVYPNPTNNLIVIENGNYALMNNYTIKLANSLGQVLFTSPVNVQTITIDLSQLTSAGLFFLQVYNPNNQLMEEKKIVLY